VHDRGWRVSRANTLTRNWKAAMAREAVRLVLAGKTDSRDFDDCWENGVDGWELAWLMGQHTATLPQESRLRVARRMAEMNHLAVCFCLGVEGKGVTPDLMREPEIVAAPGLF